MWYAIRLAPEGGHDFASSANELIKARSRSLILAIGGVYGAFAFATALHPSEHFTVVVWTIFPLIASALLVSFKLLEKRFLLSQIIWQVAFLLAIVLETRISQQPEVMLFCALIPLTAILTIGWQASLVAEAFVIGATWWVAQNPVMPSLSAGLILAAVLGGAVTGLLGWTATHALLAATQWSLFYYEQARDKMEEARDQRLELKQIQQDLLQANQELARLSDRLKAMYRVAEEARRAKEEFVANVSHELRTPLNMIIGFSEMITEAPQVYGNHLPPSLLSDIEAIRSNSQNLAKLVNDVLDLSQVEAGRMALTKEWTQLSTIVDAAVVAVREFIMAKGLTLTVDVSADLPTVFCDGTRIRQVLLNLLSNASRFTETGGVRIEVRPERQVVRVSVSDTGPGIAREDQENLFEPFSQVDASLRRQHGGSGLGLSISKRFVEMHGGRMWLESTVGVGTTFHFTLPIETPLPVAIAGADDALRWFSPFDEHEFHTRTRRSKAPAPSVAPRFVFLDPGKTLQRLFTRYMNGFETFTARDADEALSELGRSPAQALIMNASPRAEMPISREQLAGLPYDTPAIACWVPGEDETARRLGVLHYLVKPVPRETLLATLADLGDHVKRVLIVDDEPEALQLFARMLISAGRGYRVMRAETGLRALSMLRERKPDVMLLDLIMPGMDGFQVLQEKSQDPSIRPIPVIVISSRDPHGEPIVSDMLTVTRGGGLSVRELLSCIGAVTEILVPDFPSGSPEQPEMPAG